MWRVHVSRVCTFVCATPCMVSRGIVTYKVVLFQRFFELRLLFPEPFPKLGSADPRKLLLNARHLVQAAAAHFADN